jgi:hypothetical protein
MHQWSAWLRFYFKINPDELNEDEFIERWVELEYCLKKLEKLQ